MIKDRKRIFLNWILRFFHQYIWWSWAGRQETCCCCANALIESLIKSPVLLVSEETRMHGRKDEESRRAGWRRWEERDGEQAFHFTGSTGEKNTRCNMMSSSESLCVSRSRSDSLSSAAQLSVSLSTSAISRSRPDWPVSNPSSERQRKDNQFRPQRRALVYLKPTRIWQKRSEAETSLPPLSVHRGSKIRRSLLSCLLPL